MSIVEHVSGRVLSVPHCDSATGQKRAGLLFEMLFVFLPITEAFIFRRQKRLQSSEQETTQSVEAVGSCVARVQRLHGNGQ